MRWKKISNNLGCGGTIIKAPFQFLQSFGIYLAAAFVGVLTVFYAKICCFLYRICCWLNGFAESNLI